ERLDRSGAPALIDDARAVYADRPVGVNVQQAAAQRGGSMAGGAAAEEKETGRDRATVLHQRTRSGGARLDLGRGENSAVHCDGPVAGGARTDAQDGGGAG